VEDKNNYSVINLFLLMKMTVDENDPVIVDRPLLKIKIKIKITRIDLPRYQCHFLWGYITDNYLLHYTKIFVIQ